MPTRFTRFLRSLSLAVLIAALAACGGDGGTDNLAVNQSGGGSSGGGTTANFLPTVYTNEGRVLNSCSFNPVCSGNPLAPFFAVLRMAPATQTNISGVVRLEVYGNEMRNVELLPVNGYAPLYGRFNVSGDGVFAWLDLDTRRLPNGIQNLRISAFNAPPGQPANEIVVMPARGWNVANSGSVSNQLRVTAVNAPANGANVSGTIRLEVRGSGIVNAELLPASGYTPRLGVFNVSPDRTVATLDLDTRSLPNGPNNLRISVFNVTQGQPGGVEQVAMPTRQWQVNNPAPPSPFVARVLNAPLQGEQVSGLVTLEVSGTGLANVELLPAQGYLPRLASFSVTSPNFATVTFDTRNLPNGPFTVRISAFNAPAGQPANEIVAMPVRTWDIRN